MSLTVSSADRRAKPREPPKIASIDWKSLYHTLSSQWSMLNLERAVKFVDNTSFLEERMPDLGVFVTCNQPIPHESIVGLEAMISQYYTDMNIADRLPNVGYVRSVLKSDRFNIQEPYSLILAHLITISNTLQPTEKTKSDATFLCAKILRDEFTLFVYKILVAHLITAAFPVCLVEYLASYIKILDGLGGVLPPRW
jgi:hypothetical protein